MSSRKKSREGAALIIVLMSLTLLFSLGVPFLFASRVRSESSNDLLYRAQARIAVGSVSKYISTQQAGTHPAVDPTPLFDSAGEWNGIGLGPLPQSLGSDWELSRESWGVEIENTQSKISLSTAPSMLIQNLVHPCFLTAPVTHADTSISVTSTLGFPETGIVLISGSWVEYQSKNATTFLEISGAIEPPDDLEQTRFREGRFVLDPRVQNLALSNLRVDGHQTPEFFADSLEFGFDVNGSDLLPLDNRKYLETMTALSTGAYGASKWQPGTYMNREIDPERPELIRVANNLIINPGTYIRLESNTGEAFESLVVAGNGRALILASPVPEGFMAFETRVMPMTREPVDVNACRPEVLQALLTGLQFRTIPFTSSYAVTGDGRRDWVTPTEANEVTLAMLQARPIRGADDLFDRVLNPLAVEGKISDIDSWVIYLNSVDPNHAWLRQSTTGFGYRAGLEYEQRVHAAVRSRLGRTLARSSAEQVVQVAPAGRLLEMAHTQQRFEVFSSWNRGIHGVSTLPSHVVPASSSFGDPGIGTSLRLGEYQGFGRQLPASEEELSVIIPTPARDADTAPYGGQGRTEHFDISESPLGYDFSARGPIFTVVDEWEVGDGTSSNIEPLHIQGWFYAEETTDATLFDLSSSQADRNRIVAAFEEGELIIRCYGTHGEDVYDNEGREECITIRVDESFNGSSLTGRWFHLGVLLRNASARGVQVTIDGVPRGEIDNFTYLAQAIPSYAPGDTSEPIYVEDTDGFPNRGVIRVGDEIIEYTSKTANSFIVDRDLSEYFGGRSIRQATDQLVMVSDTSHPVGAGVELYGYSSILLGDIPPGGATLSGDVGPWSMANSIVGIEDIVVQFRINPNPIPIGKGISASYIGDIELAPLEQAPEDTYYAEAFQSDGGFAVIWQGGGGDYPFNIEDESRIGGIEVIRYSARNGTTLTISERNVFTPGLEEAPEGYFSEEGTSFIMEFEDYVFVGEDGQVSANEYVPFNVYIMPISIKTNGASDLTYWQPTIEETGFVQIAPSSNADATEWVRYDNIIDGCFVRDYWESLNEVVSTLFEFDPENGGADIPGGAGPRGRVSLFVEEKDDLIVENEDSQDPDEPPYAFRATIGDSSAVNERNEFLNEALERYSFRGVMGTFDHGHQAGEKAIPVFKTVRAFGPANLVADPGYGHVGRFDRVAIMQADEDADPFWYEVQWATTQRVNDGRADSTANYIAFTDFPGLPYLGPNLEDLWSRGAEALDFRNYNRITKFPNHERPARLESFTVGIDAAGTGGALTGYVDELALHAVGGFGDPTSFFATGGFFLTEDLSDTEEDIIQVHEYDFSVNQYRYSLPNTSAGQYLEYLPASGILDIDGERIAYSSIDTALGQFLIAPNGRGLHGTEQRGHSSGARVRIADGRLATTLTSDMSSSSSVLTLEDSNTLPTYGMLLVDEELMYVPMRGRGEELAMPQLRSQNNLSSSLGSDQLGATRAGIFRGRFGTSSESHSAGAVAYHFPTRWLDLYAPRSNSGLSAWYEIGLEQPQAFWRGVGYDVDSTSSGSSRVVCLARAGEASWEDSPEDSRHLTLFEDGFTSTGELQPLNFLSDRLELRFHFDWQQGAFDPISFSATGWTEAPRIRNILIDYLAETKKIRDVEVNE